MPFKADLHDITLLKYEYLNFLLHEMHGVYSFCHKSLSYYSVIFPAFEEKNPKLLRWIYFLYL